MSPSTDKPILSEGFKVGRATMPVLVDPYNRRFKLMGWTAEDVGVVGLRTVCERAGEATKGIAYSRQPSKSAFEALGFNYEAVIEGYFADGSDAHLFSCFFDARRGRLNPNERAHEILREAMSKKIERAEVPVSMTSRRASPSDAAALHGFLAARFDDYPTPISKDFLADEMGHERTLFRVCMLDGDIVACCSAEIDHDNGNAEISDCATRPDVRGKGIVSALICEVERDIASQYKVSHAYSLARAGEAGMNCALAKCGYRFTGRLVNNCRMPNGWESIHVWCRSLDA